MTRVCKLEVYVIDHDDVGDGIGDVIENARYPNRCINPHVLAVEWRDIGEWTDDHPLNQRGSGAAFRALFAAPVSGPVAQCSEDVDRDIDGAS